MRPETRSTGPTIPAFVVIGVVVVGGTSLLSVLHHRVHGAFNVTQTGLAFFLTINVLISWWEIGLLACQDQIRAEYEAWKEPCRGRELQCVARVLARRIPLFRALSLRQWTGVWSSYSLFDPGYADRRSFGYTIDVGNGFTTIVPSVLFALGMTFELLSAPALGIVGVVIFWQMFYGTALYFFQFLHNGRHKGHSTRDLILFVGITNLTWLVFPAWGFATSVQLVIEGSYGLLR